MLRVDEGEGTVNRGRSLWMMIDGQRYVCRPPTAAEREALEKGIDALGVRADVTWPTGGGFSGA